MTKKDFREWLLYLKSHPDDAALLLDVLQDAQPKEEPQVLWVTAKRIADEIGKKPSFVKKWAREGFIFYHARKSGEGRKEWMFDLHATINDWNEFNENRFI